MFEYRIRYEVEGKRLWAIQPAPADCGECGQVWEAGARQLMRDWRGAMYVQVHEQSSGELRAVYGY